MRANAAMYQRPLIGGVILLLYAATASGQVSSTESTSDASSSSAAQVIYKGVVGNLLDAVPLDAADRVQLQRLNALVSNPLAGHSLAVAVGIASPPLMLVGLIWGAWSAAKIKPKDAAAERPAHPAQQNAHVVPGGRVAPTHREHDEALLKLDPPDVLRKAVSRGGDDGIGYAATNGNGLGDRPEAAPLVRLPRYVAADALATVVGASASASPAVLCDNCVMPMLYPRASPISR